MVRLIYSPIAAGFRAQRGKDVLTGGEMMKRLAILTLALLLIAGVAYAKDYEVKKKAGDYEIKAKIDKNPPVVGVNQIKIEIKDASGKYINDAKVKIEYSMPAMPGMPPMNYKTDAEFKGSEYKANLNFSMAGPWNVVIKVTRDGKTSSMKFNIDIR